jgi:hypothetical protein
VVLFLLLGFSPKEKKIEKKQRNVTSLKNTDCVFFGWEGSRFYPGSPSGVISLTRGAGMTPDAHQILNAHWFSTSLRWWNSSHEEVMTVSVRGWGAECMMVVMQKEENELIVR